MKANSSLYSFVGSELKNLRKYRNITQDKLSQISGVSVKTIRNIEKGYVDCNITTLFLLFESLGIDPLDIFNEINGSSIYLTNSIINDLDKDIKALKHNLIPNHLSKLKEIKNSGVSSSQERYLEYNILLYSGIYEYSISKDYDISLELLTNALNLYFNNFNINKFQNYNYNIEHFRALSNISLIFNKQEHANIYSNMSKFLFDSFKSEKNPNLHYIYSYAVSRNRQGKYKESYDLVKYYMKKIGMEYDPTYYILMCYFAGITGAKLKTENWQSDLKFSYNLSKSLVNSNLSNKIYESVVYHHGLILN